MRMIQNRKPKMNFMGIPSDNLKKLYKHES